MLNLIKLFLTNALSSYFYGEKKRIPIFPIIILIVLSVFQMNFVTPDKQSNAPIIGLLIVGLFTLYTLFGLLSTRLPSKMEDVIWIYTTPISIFKIGVAVALSILGLEFLGVLFGSIYYEYPFWKGLIFVVFILLALMGLRIFLFTQTYTETTNLSIQVYFRNAFLVVAAVGMNVVSFFLLFTQLEFTIIPIILLGILLGCISFLTFQKHYLMKYLFGLSLVFCILIYGIKHLLA